MDLTKKTIEELCKGYEAGEFTPLEVVRDYLQEIESHNKKLNAYVSITADTALQQAQTSTENWQKKQARPLEGVPLGIKDLYATKNVHTQACSKILENFKPPYESKVTENLFNEGAIMLGKCNMDEFAMGSATQTSCYGDTINAWATKDGKPRTAGGSSGGSAAAVASNLCAAATGSDTGGSIRQPAAFTGSVGIKPTYGRCSRYGMIAFASSLDQAGPITKNTYDAALMLKAMAGWDRRDATCVDLPVPDYTATIGKSIKGLKVGIAKEYRIEGMDSQIETLWQKGIDILREAGAEIIDISLPHTKYALPAYYIVAPAEASSNLARYDGVKYGLRVEADDINSLYEKTRGAGFGDEVKRRILIGTYVLSAGYYDAYYVRAQKVRSLIAQDFENAFKNVDVILTPTTPGAAFTFDDESFKTDPIKMYLNDIFTVTANMAGLPAISVPAGLDENNLPLGLQFISSAFNESLLFQFSQVIEKSVGRLHANEWWKS